jgi:hypothetical protein
MTEPLELDALVNAAHGYALGSLPPKSIVAPDGGTPWMKDANGAWYANGEIVRYDDVLVRVLRVGSGPDLAAQQEATE